MYFFVLIHGEFEYLNHLLIGLMRCTLAFILGNFNHFFD